MGGPPCAPRLLSDTARLQDAPCRAPRPPRLRSRCPPAPGGSGLQPELLRVPVAPCRGVGRLRCARWPRSGGRGPSEPVRNRHVIRLVTDTMQGAGKRERGPQSRATSSAVRRGRARRGALHPRLLQLGSPSATRSRRFGFLTFLPRHSIIVFPGRRKLFLNIIVAGVSAAHRALGPALGLNLDVDVAPGPGTSQGPRRAVVPVPADGAGRAGRAHGPTARDGGGRAEHSCGGEGGLAVSGDGRPGPRSPGTSTCPPRDPGPCQCRDHGGTEVAGSLCPGRKESFPLKESRLQTWKPSGVGRTPRRTVPGSLSCLQRAGPQRRWEEPDA